VEAMYPADHKAPSIVKIYSNTRTQDKELYINDFFPPIFVVLNVSLGIKTAINVKIIESKKFQIIWGSPANMVMKNSIIIRDVQVS
jgi:hypothetical protein